MRKGYRRPEPPALEEPKYPKSLGFPDEFWSALRAETAVSPLELMRSIMLLKVSQSEYDAAIAIAEKAAPFVHPTLRAAEVRVQHSLNARSDSEVAEEIQLLRFKLQTARDAGLLIDGSAESPPDPPPSPAEIVMVPQGPQPCTESMATSPEPDTPSGS
jgi:hypothetical protein